MALNHAFTSAIADGADATLVRPSNWNADHVVSGTSLQILFNNAGSLTGMSGTSWDDTNRSLTLTGATVTASNPIFNLTQTWNNAATRFQGITLSITQTANETFSSFFEFLGGAAGATSALKILAGGIISWPALTGWGGAGSTGASFVPTGTTQLCLMAYGSGYNFCWEPAQFKGQASAAIGWVAANDAHAAIETYLSRSSTGIININGATPATIGSKLLYIYNTYTDASNYERGVFDWTTTANTLTIGTQAAGTGTLRAVALVGSAIAVTAGTFGYGTGVGGAVTQITSRTTGVTLNNICGAITLVSAAGSATPATFTVTNSAVAATDTIIINQKSGTDLYEIFITAVAAGSFNVTFFTTGGTTTEQPVFNFAVLKAVAA